MNRECFKSVLDERIGMVIAAILLCLLFFSGFRVIGQEAFKVEHPYRNLKPFQYKASLHNHTRFHPENTHALNPAGQRLMILAGIFSLIWITAYLDFPGNDGLFFRGRKPGAG